jgi:hypothetical protein
MIDYGDYPGEIFVFLVSITHGRPSQTNATNEHRNYQPRITWRQLPGNPPASGISLAKCRTHLPLTARPPQGSGLGLVQVDQRDPDIAVRRPPVDTTWLPRSNAPEKVVL